jgi:hypothetical protein
MVLRLIKWLNHYENKKKVTICSYCGAITRTENLGKINGILPMYFRLRFKLNRIMTEGNFVDYVKYLFHPERRKGIYAFTQRKIY